MEFACSICGYTSLKKENITKHFNRKRSCGPGIKEIVEIPIDINCKYCEKKFASSTSLKYHQKNSCKSRDIAMQKEINDLKEKVKELQKEGKTTINNQTINNNQTYNIIIVNNYEDTRLEQLTDKDINKIIKDSDEPISHYPTINKRNSF